MDETWTDEIEHLLEKIRVNSINLSEYHRQKFYYWQSYGKYFRIPVIILASVNSTASVGLQKFIAQKWISLLSCFIGMLIGIMGSIELYLSIQECMDLEYKQSKEFYSLSIDIYKILYLKRVDRNEDGKQYLNDKFSYYIKLVEASNLLHNKMNIDLLAIIPRKLDNLITNPSTLSKSISNDNLTDTSIDFNSIHLEYENLNSNNPSIGHVINNSTDENKNNDENV